MYFTGDVIISRHHHECVICRRAVTRGSMVKAAAYDLLAAGRLVWCHPQCADLWAGCSGLQEVIRITGWREAGGFSRLLSDGWLEIEWPQPCHFCRAHQNPGSIMHRVTSVPRRCYDMACHGCWRASA